MVVREMSNLKYAFPWCRPQIPFPGWPREAAHRAVLNTYLSEDKPISEIT